EMGELAGHAVLMPFLLKPAHFEATGKPRAQGGWYVVPGLAEAPVWGLLIVFTAIILFLAWFGSLG
ncbi:MAG: hypothetical protein AAFQ13_02670, partial [Pseudomonadota bacterium]